jgi:hypothetical protein
MPLVSSGARSLSEFFEVLLLESGIFGWFCGFRRFDPSWVFRVYPLRQAERDLEKGGTDRPLPLLKKGDRLLFIGVIKKVACPLFGRIEK